MKNITVIGAGTMGNGIAHTFAQKDFNVNLVDISADALERAIATIGKNLDRMVKKEKITEADKANTLANITTYTDISAGVKGVDLVVEAATENVDLKFTEDGIDMLAKLSAEVNSSVENIGARRLHTIIEKVLDEISFNATDRSGEKVVIDAAYVIKHLGKLVKDTDLSKFIL